MNKKNIFLSIATLALILFNASNIDAQNTKQSTKTTTTSNAAIEVIQFHSQHRCMTCNNIEKYTQETLQSYTSIPFSLVNVDDAKNEKQATQFEAAGTALYLYNPKTGKKKDLTDFAFMNASNKDKFIAGLKKEIDQFSK